MRAQLEREAITLLLCILGQEFSRAAAKIAPTRHPVDPEKSNRALGFPALVTGLYQSYRVLVPPRQGYIIIGKYAHRSTDF